MNLDGVKNPKTNMFSSSNIEELIPRKENFNRKSYTYYTGRVAGYLTGLKINRTMS
jgi:hypothetical protein